MINTYHIGATASRPYKAIEGLEVWIPIETFCQFLVNSNASHDLHSKTKLRERRTLPHIYTIPKGCDSYPFYRSVLTKGVFHVEWTGKKVNVSDFSNSYVIKSD